MFRKRGQVEEAVALHKFVVQGRWERLGPDHWKTLLAMEDLATAYQVQGQRREAEVILAQVLECRLKELGAADAETVRTTKLLEKLNLGESLEQITGR
jgi:lipopolysaccharide biosynthesis regulator YciM